MPVGNIDSGILFAKTESLTTIGINFQKNQFNVFCICNLFVIVLSTYSYYVIGRFKEELKMLGNNQLSHEEHQLIMAMSEMFQELNQENLPDFQRVATQRVGGRRISNHRANTFIKPDTVNKIKEITIKVLNVLGLFIASVFSLGIFTLIPCYLQFKKIQRLEDSIDGESQGISYKWSQPIYQKNDSDPKNIQSSLQSTKLGQSEKIKEIRAELNGVDDMNELLIQAKVWANADIIDRNLGFGDQDVDSILTNRWVVYLLVKHAGLEYACDQVTAFLSVNSYLKVGRSEACQIKKTDNNAVHHCLLHKDDWTPNDLEEFPNGIDPISLKYLLFHLESNPEAMKHFETLLMIDSEDERCVVANKWLEKSGVEAKKVKAAVFLVDEISRVLEGRYSKVFTPREMSEKVNSTDRIVEDQKYSKTEGVSVITVDKVKSIAIDILKWVGVALASALSFGLVPFGLYIYQHYKIKGLENGTVLPSKTGVKCTYRKPKYKKKEEDRVAQPINKKSLNQLLKLNQVEEDIDTIESLEPLIEGAFIDAFDTLTLSSRGGLHGVVFSKNSKINDLQKVYENWTETYINNKNALYNWIVYQLIPLGSVREDEKTKEHRLHFSEKLSVGFSHSCSIPSRDKKSLADFFLDLNEWTVKGKTERSGIDPISVFWILNQIKESPSAQEALESLLLSALIPDEEQSLKNAKLFISENSEEAKLVKIAYELIGDIGRSFGAIYKNPFYLLWEDLANDDKVSSPLLLKESGGVDVSELGNYVDWIPNLAASPDYPQYPIAQTKSILTPLWKDIHKYRIKDNIKGVADIPRNEEEALKLLSKQYYWIHVNVNDHHDEEGAGCILSALCIYLYQATDAINNINPQNMRDAFSDYLIVLMNGMDNKPTAIEKEKFNYFKREIEQCTKEGDSRPGWTVQEYASWLLTGQSPPYKKIRGHFDMGQLEIDLFCNVFRIGVQVFRGGEPYRLEKGMMLPVRGYGPKTHEQVILFNATGETGEGFSFYALMPKMRSPITTGGVDKRDPPDVVNALSHNRGFWGTNHRKEWGQNIEVHPV
jgi:hypothetical protein